MALALALELGLLRHCLGYSLGLALNQVLPLAFTRGMVFALALGLSLAKFWFMPVPTSSSTSLHWLPIPVLVFTLLELCIAILTSRKRGELRDEKRQCVDAVDQLILIWFLVHYRLIQISLVPFNVITSS